MNAHNKLKDLKIYGRNLSSFLLPDQIKFIEIAMEEYALEKNVEIDANFYHEKRKRILAKFMNKKMYYTSPVYNQVVEMLIHDVDPYKIIEELCIINEDYLKQLKESYEQR